MDGVAPEILHAALCLAGLGGLALLAARRRREALAIGLLVLGITVVGAVLLASTRRNLILMPIVISLAGLAVSWLVVHLSSAGSWSRPSSSLGSSPPS
jgi:O-antigen ligase